MQDLWVMSFFCFFVQNNSLNWVLFETGHIIKPGIPVISLLFSLYFLLIELYCTN
jgi:hypothetical protein